MGSIRSIAACRPALAAWPASGPNRMDAVAPPGLGHGSFTLMSYVPLRHGVARPLGRGQGVGQAGLAGGPKADRPRCGRWPPPVMPREADEDGVGVRGADERLDVGARRLDLRLPGRLVDGLCVRGGGASDAWTG